MHRILVAVVVAAALQTAQPLAQTPAPAAAPVTLDAVAKALGASKGLTQIQFSATGSNNAYGQAWKADMPWPAFKIFSYTATVDRSIARYQPAVPGPPLNGPRIRLVTHPP